MEKGPKARWGRGVANNDIITKLYSLIIPTSTVYILYVHVHWYLPHCTHKLLSSQVAVND